MNPILRNILAVIVGCIGGSILNMLIVSLSGMMIPPPAGMDVNDMESIRANAHLFEAKHFIFPFLAHALGTLAGAWICARIAATRHMLLAMVVGILFLVGGIAAAAMIPAPMWFIVLDLGVAYLPMAWLGGKLGARKPATT